MIVTQLIILQIIAHLISDFVLQPQSWCDKKEKEVFTSHIFYHSAIVLVTSYILSFDFGFWKAAILLTVIHFLIDAVKSIIIQKTKNNYLFFIDQLLHLITIIGIVLLYDRIFGVRFLFKMETKILIIIAGFLFCAKPANIVIKFLLRSFAITISVDESDNNGEKSLPNAGKLIGIAERFLALALILLGQYE
ncbi:MAG TPA: DUF3307 domain-containing protein, partial [Prolixibacteraceae bacterium]|nr:DUF3307 domain-containing protein [Prolixibacteraceae bacterium]